MTSAVVNLCFDPRLDHEAIRTQVRGRIERLRLKARSIYLVNDLGGNVGSGLRNAVRLRLSQREEVSLTAVLHHDDCLAAKAGRRKPLEVSAKELAAFLAELNLRTPVLTGTIRTADNLLTWTDEPAPSFETLTFRMPRMFG